MMRFLSLILLTILFFSCETGELTSTPSELEGVWIFKGYKYGMPGCEDEPKKVTLEITRKGNVFEISGRSFINTYFSRAEVSYNTATQNGTIEFESIGTTKMGGPENLMNCEMAYYQLLAGSTNVKIENQRLYLGRESRVTDSGIPEILIFERQKN